MSLLSGLGFGLAFYAAAQAVGLSDLRYRGRFAFDALNYHEPTVRVFAETFPRADVSDYWSATTPLYHYLLAGVAQIDGSRTTLMAAGGLFTLALLTILGAWCARTLGVALGLAFALPVATSMYVFTQGVWMLPDNAGWLGVLLMLAVAWRPRFDWFTIVAGGMTLALLVATRQIHAWTGGLIVAAAWLGSASHTPRSFTGLFSDLPIRARRAVLGLLATAPAAAVVIGFIALWGGLIVPHFQGKYSGANPATPAFFLSVTGVVACFFAGAIAPALVNAWRRHRVLLVGSLLAALALAAVPETSYDTDAWRYSGLWNVVRALPLIAGRTSPLILMLAPIGAAALVAICTSVRPRTGWILAATAAGFVTAQTASPVLWQRYHEPMVLMLLILGSAELVHLRRDRCGGSSDPGPLALFTFVGPVVLSLLFVGLTVTTITKNANWVTPVHDGALEIAHAAEPIPAEPGSETPIPDP